MFIIGYNWHVINGEHSIHLNKFHFGLSSCHEKKFKVYAPQSVYIWLTFFKLIEFGLPAAGEWIVSGMGMNVLTNHFCPRVARCTCKSPFLYPKSIILLLGFISCSNFFLFQLLGSLRSLTFLIILCVFQSHCYHRDWFTTQQSICHCDVLDKIYIAGRGKGKYAVWKRDCGRSN